MVHIRVTAGDPITEDEREKKRKGREIPSQLPDQLPAWLGVSRLALGLSCHGEKSPSSFHSAESGASLQAGSGLASAWDLPSGPTPPHPDQWGVTGLRLRLWGPLVRRVYSPCCPQNAMSGGQAARECTVTGSCHPWECPNIL